MTGVSPEAEFAALVRARRLRPIGPSHLDAALRRLAAFFAQAALRDAVASRPGLLQRVEPRARLAAALAFLVSVSLARSIPALLLHGLLPLAALGLSRVRPRELLRAGLGAAAVFALLIAVPATLNLFVEGRVVVPLLRLEGGRQLGPLLLPPVIGLTAQGLLGAATFLLRVLVSVSAVLWLTLSTSWIDLLRALRALGLPPLVVQVVGMTVRYLFAFQRMVEEAYLGRKSRTICRLPAGGERAWVASRVGQSWERSVGLMAEVGEAMLARGFTGEVPSPGRGRFGGRGWALLLATLLACGAAHVF